MTSGSSFGLIILSIALDRIMFVLSSYPCTVPTKHRPSVVMIVAFSDISMESEESMSYNSQNGSTCKVRHIRISLTGDKRAESRHLYVWAKMSINPRGYSVARLTFERVTVEFFMVQRRMGHKRESSVGISIAIY
jgi:hypothetical protein